MQAWSLKIDSLKNWILMGVATVMRKNIIKLIMLLSMILMHQFIRVPTNTY